jgi:hypothetical protein
MKTWIKILLAAFVVGIIGIALIYIFIYNKPHPNYEKMVPQYTLNAQELYDSYKSNKTAAEQKYNGKLIEIKGKLGHVETHDSITIAVFVFSQGDFGDEGIRCTLIPKFNEDAKKLVPEGIIRIKGYCEGFSDSDVILEQCAIIYQ